MKVTLREKKLLHDKKSLYLDFYPPIIEATTGKPTRREFLSLYVFERPKNDLERLHNKETRMLAANVCAKRQLELQENAHGFTARSKRRTDFLEFFREAVADRKDESTALMWQISLNYFAVYCGDAGCSFARLDRDFVESFRDYLLTCKSRRSLLAQLSPNTAATLFQRFCSVVKLAVEKGYIAKNPAVGIAPIKTVINRREFLTLDELRLLAKTPCDISDNLRRAALFSALTGLRFSDISLLTWSNLRQSTELGDFLDFVIKKTGEPLVLPIAAEAREYLGEAGKPTEQIFPGLRYSVTTNVYLQRWAVATGISRKITFHCFRRTFATAQITLGTDI
jgi:integrase